MTEQESPKVRIVEVGPRDGLQSLNAHYSVETRLEWIGKLAHAGIQEIECGAFVRADLVPAMANSSAITPPTTRCHSGVEATGRCGA